MSNGILGTSVDSLDNHHLHLQLLSFKYEKI